MPRSPRQTPSSALAGHGSPGRVLRSAGTVGGLTLLSRVCGYLRDAILAGLLGTSHVMDAWGAAFQIPNALRRLASEGNLSAAFVPVFSQVERRRPAGVWDLADRFHAAALIVVAALAAAGIATAHLVVPLIYAGFGATPGKLELTITLTRLLFIYALFISLNAVLMAVLNARDRFAAAAFTPVLLNLAIIGFGVAAWLSAASDPVYWVVAGVIVGGFAQWAFLVPFARRLGMRFRLRPGFGDADLREVGRLIVPRLLGVGVVQVNIFVGQILAAGLGQGAIAALYYASRLQELTLGVFAVSVATVVLPTMSRQGAAGDRQGMRSTLTFALRQVTAVTLPASVGVIVLRQQIVAVLFERGAFDAGSTALSASALAGFGVGLAAVAAARILAPGFYALQDTRSPVWVATGGVAVNLLACLALRGPLGVGGIALANSIAAAGIAALLLVLLRRRLGRLEGRLLLASTARIAAASAAMGAAVVVLPTPWEAAAGATAQAVDLLVRVVAGIAVYLGALLVLRAPELRELAEVVAGKRPGTLGKGGGDAGSIGGPAGRGGDR